MNAENSIVVMQIKEGTAYIRKEFVADAQANLNSLRPLHLADFVIDPNGNIIKSRYSIDELIQTFLTVNSSPFLQALTRFYAKNTNLINKA